MKDSYPIILTREKTGYTVYIPDFNTNTEGKDITESIEMARDAIGIMGIDMEDDGKSLPKASKFESIKSEKNQLVTFVDVDFVEYRRMNETRVVRKNCTLPSWLCYEAEKANINFSQVLQKALKEELQIAN